MRGPRAKSGEVGGLPFQRVGIAIRRWGRNLFQIRLSACSVQPFVACSFLAVATVTCMARIVMHARAPPA